ncbi:MAG: Fic family protein [Clostridiales Family XIII bacterium]|jgi:Fic family protein|nr:Fic family protein [Clostridiales Family XIII bacterium]
MNEDWKPIGYEVHDWDTHLDNPYISNTQRRRIKSTYQSSLPLEIKKLDVITDKKLALMIDETLVLMARFDAIQSVSRFNFPAMLLRSESSASSQIENLTSSIRNVAMAELSEKAPKNAQLIAGNVSAMKKALELSSEISVSTILQIHKALIAPTKEDFAGNIRDEQVWVGGSPYSPHDAIFVPPHHSLIAAYLDDLVLYSKRTDINPIVKAAVIHAQFETIHPFIDGNGRTGRVLIHDILKLERVLLTATLPISAGLLHNIDDYMNALRRYQAGDPLPIILQITKALELAVNIGFAVTNKVEAILKSWEDSILEKKTSGIRQMIHLLVEQPVVNAKYLSERLEITDRAARNMLSRAVDYGILRRLGNEHRGVFFQADEIIKVMDEVSDIKNIRRLISK